MEKSNRIIWSLALLLSCAVGQLAQAQQSAHVTSAAAFGKGAGAVGNGVGPTGDLGDFGGPVAPNGDLLEPDPGFGEDLLASGETFGAGPLSLAPGFIGDLIVSSPTFGSGTGPNSGTIPIAAGDRRFKIIENTSPVPTDRVFFKFNHFSNSVLGNDGRIRDLERYTFGVEKTFNNGLWSLEVRVPFASGLDNTQRQTIAFEGTEFGNIPIVFKSIFWENPCALVSGGFSTVLPTAEDALLFNDAGTSQLMRIENEIVYLQPFLAFLYAPRERVFVQGLAQADFALGQNSLFDATGSPSGELANQHLLYLSASGGFWAYRNPCARYLTGLAPMAEIHYTTPLNDGDIEMVNGQMIGQFNDNYNIVNATGALHAQIGYWSSFRVFASAPLTDRDDRQYDAEVGAQFIRQF